MKRCDEKATGLPNVESGDTVERTAGHYKGTIWLVAHTAETGKENLYCLGTGEVWSSNNLWGDSISGWRKVQCCYSVKEVCHD